MYIIEMTMTMHRGIYIQFTASLSKPQIQEKHIIANPQYMYLYVYVCVYIYSDTSSTCSLYVHNIIILCQHIVSS